MGSSPIPGKAEEAGHHHLVAPVLLAEDALQVPFFRSEVQSVHEEKGSDERKALQGAARECDSEQHDPPANDLWIPAEAVGAGGDEPTRFQTGYLSTATIKTVGP